MKIKYSALILSVMLLLSVSAVSAAQPDNKNLQWGDTNNITVYVGETFRIPCSYLHGDIICSPNMRYLVQVANNEIGAISLRAMHSGDGWIKIYPPNCEDGLPITYNIHIMDKDWL